MKKMLAFVLVLMMALTVAASAETLTWGWQLEVTYD